MTQISVPCKRFATRIHAQCNMAERAGCDGRNRQLAVVLASADQDCPVEEGSPHGKPKGSKGSRLTGQTGYEQKNKEGYLQKLCQLTRQHT